MLFPGFTFNKFHPFQHKVWPPQKTPSFPQSALHNIDLPSLLIVRGKSFSVCISLGHRHPRPVGSTSGFKKMQDKVQNSTVSPLFFFQIIQKLFNRSLICRRPCTSSCPRESMCQYHHKAGSRDSIKLDHSAKAQWRYPSWT